MRAKYTVAFLAIYFLKICGYSIYRCLKIIVFLVRSLVGDMLLTK
jgi:hypothetical protein